MIPAIVEAHLRAEHSGYEHHVHPHAETAWGLAGIEHAAGERVSKSVVLSINGELSIAVVAATDRVDIDLLERVTGSRVTLVAEDDFAARFQPCAPGAEPPLAIFGTPINVDDKLLRLQKLVMAAGTYEDAVIVDTSEWARCEKVRPVSNLGRRATAMA